MKYLKLSLAVIITLAMYQTSCGNKSENLLMNKAEINGGNCTYLKFEGYAKIKSITPAPASEYNCPDNPHRIIFEFIPANLSDRQKYRFTNFSDSALNMRINDGANPSLSWIKKNKIEAGKKFRCFRTELSAGTCTPVVFTFPDLNLFPETGCK